MNISDIRHPASDTAKPLGIIAGSGALPSLLVEDCRKKNRPVFVLGFENATDMQPYAHLPHASVRLAAVGEALQHLRHAGANEIVMAGGIRRPSLASLKPDATGAKLMARLGTKLFGGDDALLKALVGFLEEEGFKVVGAQDVLGALMAPAGALGHIRPSAKDETDIALGFKVAKTLGAFDIGQAVIVESGCVLGVEAAEGTAALISRVASLKREMRGGVLVKASKPGQEMRTDLPAIGIHTVEHIYESGLSGIAVEAGMSLVLEKDKVIARADELGMFVVGVRHGK